MNRPRRSDIQAYIGLGSNLANPVSQVRSGFAALSRITQSHVDACSSLYRTAPIGRQDQPDFINAVCHLCTLLSPTVLMQTLLAIEQKQGRVREREHGEPRILDLDLLLYGDETIQTADLTVPHPRLHERAFVLYPLFELEPALVVPGKGTVRELLEQCSGQPVQKLDERAE
jgi:2-amino-4-hydroxy-6-hydroxymethyldihydropteridine diphosphokinase